MGDMLKKVTDAFSQGAPTTPYGAPTPGLGELMLRSAPAILPPPGQWRVGSGMGSRVGATAARFGQSLAGNIGNEMMATRQDPTADLERLLRDAGARASGNQPSTTLPDFQYRPQMLGETSSRTALPEVGGGFSSGGIRESTLTEGPGQQLTGPSRGSSFIQRFMRENMPIKTPTPTAPPAAPSMNPRVFAEFFGQQTPVQQAALAAGIGPRFKMPEGAFFKPEVLHALSPGAQMFSDTRGVVGSGGPQTSSGEYNPSPGMQQRVIIQRWPDGRITTEPMPGPTGAPSAPTPVYKPDTPEQEKGRKLVNQIREETFARMQRIASGQLTEKETIAAIDRLLWLKMSGDPDGMEFASWALPSLQAYAEKFKTKPGGGALGSGARGPAATGAPSTSPSTFEELRKRRGW